MISPTIENTSLFMLVPKLFLAYKPNFQDCQTSPSRFVKPLLLSRHRRHNNSEVFVHQTDDTIRQIKTQTSEAIDNVDCFLFKMLCTTSGDMSRRQRSDIVDGEAEGKDATRIDDPFSLEKEKLAATQIALSQIVFENRKLILKNLSKVLRVSVKIVTKVYQHNLVLKQLVYESVQGTGLKTQNFFKILSESVKQHSQLMDVLCISPEDLNIVCRMT